MNIQNRLVVMIEGNPEEDFINKIVKPIFFEKNKYKDLVLYKYAKKPRIEIAKFIEAVHAIGDDILCIHDIDSAPCITEKKKQLQIEKVGNLDNNCIIIVTKEIESWYLAGIDKKYCKKLGIEYRQRTEKISKKTFNEIVAKSKYKPKNYCMNEMIKYYDVSLAKSRNRSFNYFYTKQLEN